MEGAKRASLLDKETCLLSVQEVVVAASRLRIRGSLLMVYLLPRTPLMVFLIQKELVLGNRTYQHIDCRCFEPQVSFTYHHIYASGTIA